MIPKLSTKSRKRAPIGVFDSGVGGLSVLRELRRLLPSEHFLFLADQAHVPYGAKSPHQLELLSERATRFLLGRGCKLVVVACNTATCYAISHLRRTFSVPFVGTVPAVKPACKTTRNGVVAVISTPATARSAALAQLIREHGAGARVVRRGCAGLEELVEAGGADSPAAFRLLKKHLAPVLRSRADVIVLGCTHYPFLAPSIRRITGMRTLDSGRAIARRTKSLLAGSGMLNNEKTGRTVFATTGSPARFSAVASSLLGMQIQAEKVRI